MVRIRWFVEIVGYCFREDSVLGGQVAAKAWTSDLQAHALKPGSSILRWCTNLKPEFKHPLGTFKSKPAAARTSGPVPFGKPCRFSHEVTPVHERQTVGKEESLQAAGSTWVGWCIFPGWFPAPCLGFRG